MEDRDAQHEIEHAVGIRQRLRRHHRRMDTVGQAGLPGGLHEVSYALRGDVEGMDRRPEFGILERPRTVAAAEVQHRFAREIAHGLLIRVQHEIHPADRVEVALIHLYARHSFIVEAALDFMPRFKRRGLL